MKAPDGRRETRAERLRRLVRSAVPRLRKIDDTRAAVRPAPGRWSPLEIVGHLVDSASNNHQRFVRARFTEAMVFDGYDQDAWVEAQRWNDAPWSDTIDLWSAFNLHLARVMEGTPSELLDRPVREHNLDRIGFRPLPTHGPVTLGWFMDDYVDHLEHHLLQLPDALP